MNKMRINIGGINYDIPVIKDANGKYTIVERLGCRCSEETQPEYYWHLDGVFNNPDNNMLYLCATCEKCQFKFMTVFKFDDIVFYMSMNGDEYKARK